MSEPMRGKVAMMGQEETFDNPIEEHTADSKWQFCNCRTCQRKRKFLGPDFPYATFRHKDEKY